MQLVANLSTGIDYTLASIVNCDLTPCVWMAIILNEKRVKYLMLHSHDLKCFDAVNLFRLSVKTVIAHLI